MAHHHWQQHEQRRHRHPPSPSNLLVPLLVSLIFLAGFCTEISSRKGILFTMFELEKKLMASSLISQHKNADLMQNDVDAAAGGGSAVRRGRPRKFHPRQVCRYFSRHQRTICLRNFDLIPSVIDGLSTGLHECQNQFYRDRWNCHGHNMTWPRYPKYRPRKYRRRRRRYRYYRTKRNRRVRSRVRRSQYAEGGGTVGLSSQSARFRPAWRFASMRRRRRTRFAAKQKKRVNRRRRLRKPRKMFLDRLVSKNTPESAFLLAIMSAGIAFQVTRSCSRESFTMCGCDLSVFNTKPSGNFKWQGCSHNIHYGVAFTRAFLGDDKLKERIEKNRESRRILINVHNNEAGRSLLVKKMEVLCRCHGMSGSCEVKTCLKSLPSFRLVGKELRKKYKQAVAIKIKQRYRFEPKVTQDQLVYVQRARTHCEFDENFGLIGTKGRQCHKPTLDQLQSVQSGRQQTTVSSMAAAFPTYAISVYRHFGVKPGNCKHLCCSRGETTNEVISTIRCRCKFKWCCKVNCDTCVKKISVHTCK